MPKLPPDNGNIKLVLPEELNAAITCGLLSISLVELVKNTMLTVILNPNPFKVIGMDLDAILTSQPINAEKKEV